MLDDEILAILATLAVSRPKKTKRHQFWKRGASSIEFAPNVTPSRDAIF